MLVKEIGCKSNRLKHSQITKYSLWNKNTSDVTAIDLHVYQKTLEIDGKGEEALQDIEELQRLTIMVMLESKLNDAPYLAYSGKEVKMTLGDFTVALYFADLSLARKKAILFALETSTKPEDVVILTRSMLARMKLSPLAQAIVDSMPRNTHMNYVFWEEVEQFEMAGPLFGLTQNFKDMFSGVSHRIVCKMFNEAILHDTHEESINFMNEVLQTTRGH